MTPISQQTLRKANWRMVYNYTSPSMSFETFGCEIEGITITHTKKAGRSKIETSYRVFGRTTDSPIQAVRYYNEEVKARQYGRRDAAGSVEQIRAKRSSAAGL